ncbi:MAG: site-specific DNA-methyltransferase [Thermoplasmata archaeon]|nr:site-specific DNA-methyltransferase [Candidatus Sysuiplasma acidicola]MBX8645934.1 site-specific DNA-methyltransferase [Candidatus Sysuiplasma acidicola]
MQSSVDYELTSQSKVEFQNEKQLIIPTSHKLIVGDARRVSMESIGNVHLVVTSPPYWTIRDYGIPGQIGFNQDLAEYIDSLLSVWRKCYDALCPGCRMIIDIGDQYLRATKHKAYQIIPLHSYVINSIMNDKRMRMDFLGTIIWRKISTTKTSGGANVMGSYPYPRNVYPCFENEFIAIFRKEGTPPRPERPFRDASKLSLAEWREFTQGVWTFPGTKAGENPSAFPETLPNRLIRMFSFPGETVLDPFVGSGTTMRAAASLGRNSIGIELGFATRSGKPFEKVIEENVLTAELETYSGQPRISVLRV